MRVKLLCSISALLPLAIAVPASADEIQKMTVEQLVNKCTAADPTSAAFCNGLATGILNQLVANSIYFRMPLASDDVRKFLKAAGVACEIYEPRLALAAFIGWAKIHPETHGNNGIAGVATAIEQAWPCKE